MAQAWLRYRSLADRLEHQGALLMFVPGADLWRDINVVRELREPWKVRAVMLPAVSLGSPQAGAQEHAEFDAFRESASRSQVTPRSRCSSFAPPGSSDASETAGASFIAMQIHR